MLETPLAFCLKDMGAFLFDFFKRFLQKFRPLRREDSLFGSMLYMGDRAKYWEAKATFPPQNREIELFVDGARDSSFEQQYLFFRHVCEEWPELQEAMRERLIQAYNQATGRLVPLPVWDEFKLDSMSISEGAFDAAEWTISLTAQSDKEHSYRIEMQGNVLTSVSWDS